MRLLITIFGVIVGAVCGVIFAGVYMLSVVGTFWILLICMGLGGFAGWLVGMLIPHRVPKEVSLEHIPEISAEFIKQVIKKMGYRRKVRADVMAELAAHFEDELANCERPQEKAQQLIAEFGDVKLLGVLLRRAKKRSRPLWRTVVARTFQLIGLLVLCLPVYVVWFYSGKAVVSTDYVAEINRVARPAADEKLNAATEYIKAAESFEQMGNDISRLLGSGYAVVSVDEKQLVEDWLRENKDAVDLGVAGAKKPYCWFEYERSDDIAGIKFTFTLGVFRKFAWALCWRSRLRAEQGNYNGAFEDIISCCRLGQHFRGDKLVIEQLVGMGIESFAIGTLEELLGQYEVGSQELAELQQKIEDTAGGENPVLSFRVEKLLTYNALERLFTDGLGGGHIIPKAMDELFPEVNIIGGAGAIRGSEYGNVGFSEDIKRLAGWIKRKCHLLFFHPGKKETFKAVEKLYAYSERLAAKTPAQIEAEGIDFKEGSWELTKGNLLLRFFAPAFANASKQAYAVKTQVDATITILGILRYKKDKGELPADLAELIGAGYLKGEPMDLYSEQGLIYRKIDGGHFLLYSVGPNFVDDGGQTGERKWDREGDVVFWPVRR